MKKSLKSICLTLIAACLLCTTNQSMAQAPDLTNGGVRTDDLSWNLGPTGMAGWFYRPNWDAKYAGWNTEFARQIEVMEVSSGSPADGVLFLGDVILGADGTGAEPVDFSYDARKAFADALADAEANSPAVLKLKRWQGTAETSTVQTVADLSGSLDGKYFILYDAAGSVGVWIDVGNSGTTIPTGASSADRAIEVTGVLAGDSAGAVASAIQTAINADSAFSAALATDIVTVTAATGGARTDIADGDTGFILAVTQQGGSVIDTVSLTLETLGAYSTTAPYNCPKSAAILEKGLDAVMALGGTDEWKFSLVTLLAGNDPSNPDNAARMARAQQEAHALILTQEQIDDCTAPEPLTFSKVAWNFGFKLTALAEYYLHTGDAEVYESLRAYAIATANGQSMFGTSGHQFAQLAADGSLNGPYGIGYGVVSSANMQCFLGLTLAKEAGVTDQAVLDAVERASNFYSAYVDRGTIPYGEHEPGKDYGDNGKSGIAALCFKAEGTRNYDANYYATLAASAAHNLDAGHQGPYLNYLWTPLGANAAGEEAMAAFFAEQSWRFDLARNYDGTFTYNSYQNGGQYGYGGPTWSGKNFQMYQAMLLPYAAPLRETYLTGKNTADPAKWIGTTELSEIQVSSGYNATTRTTTELLADLDNWSPATRIVAAAEIGIRTSEHATLLPTLHTMATDTNASLQSRMGACRALGQIRDDSSVSLLVGLLTDSNSRIKWAAATALGEFLPAALMPEIDAIMTACIDEGKPVLPIDPEDPIHLTHMEIVELLFFKILRSHDLVGINRDLLIPAIRAGATHPTGTIRSDVGGLYRKLSREEVEELADILVDGTMNEAPADRMFSVSGRMAGLNAIQSHSFAEGVRMAMTLALELNSTDALDALIAYAADSLLVEPDHEVLKWLDITEANDVNGVFTAASNWPDPGTHNHIQWVRDAINSDPGPYEKPESFKRIYSVVADDATLTLPDDWTGLHVGAYDFAKGDSLYTWRKVHGAGEVNFYPNGTAAAKDTAVVFDGNPGEYLFEVTMSDSRGFAEVRQTVAVTLEKVGGGLDLNSPPTANNQSVTVGQGAPTAIVLTGSDPEGYALDYTVTSGPSNGTLSGTAPSLVYTASPGYTGSDSISFEVMDSEGQVASGTVSITVDAASSVGLAIYEPFEGYPQNPTDINGFAGTGEIGFAAGSTWTSGADIYADDTAPIGFPAGGYTYGPLPTTGSKLWHRGLNAPGQSRPIHPDALTNSGLLADGATLWFSVLIGADDTYLRRVQIALANASFESSTSYIQDDGADPGTGLGFELNQDKQFYAVQFFNSTQGTVLRGDFNEFAAGQFVRNGDLRLVVGKITWGAASDTVEMYLPLLPDAGKGIVLPDEPSSTLVANVDQSKFDVLTVSRGQNVWIDEIRVGATLQSVLMGTVDAGGIANDGVAPTPNPMTFAVAPQVSSQNSITMTATPAYDPLGVEYYFTCTAGAGGSDSGWQDSNVYTNAGLTPGEAYSYTVKARDKTPGLNETAASTAASAMIPSLGTVPDVVGIEQIAAESIITDADMLVGAVTQSTTYSLTVPSGHVLSQNPTGNTSTAYGTAVDLEISIGQDPALPTLASVDIVDDRGGLHVTLPATILYTLTFSQDMDVATIDAGDFVNLAGVPITIGAINEISPGVVTVEVTPNTIDSGYVNLAISQGAVIKDAQGNDLNTSKAIADEDWIPLVRPDNYVPVVDAGVDQTINIDSAQPWSPSAISTVAWFDAADASTITQSAGAVSQWRDKSGNDLHAGQGNATNQPTYNTSDTRLNNLPAIGYDQGFKYLQTPTITSIRNAYVVTYYDDPDNTFDTHRVLFSDTGNSLKLQGSGSNWVSGAGFNKFRDGSTTSSDANALPMGPTLWTAKGTASHTNRAWRILGGVNGFQYWEYGAVGEVILTDGTEDLATQQKIEGYLAHKWGLAANLPVDHPYKSSAPTALAAVAILDASATDNDNDPLSTAWSLVSGPAAANFVNASAVDTSATFTVAGTYVLELTANDGTGQASDQVTITVQPGNDTTAPTLSGADIVDDRSGADVSENTSINYTVTFSEDMDAATVGAGDFGNAGTAAISVGTITKTSPGVFSVGVTPTSTGSLQLQINAGAALNDLAGNALDTTTAIADDTTINVVAAPSNNAPVFTADPFSASAATEDIAYVDSIAGSATDADAGDTLSYSKVSGPAWLSVAANGDLTGTPASGDAGANAFAVSVNDGNGGSDTATLNITVNSATPNNPPVVDAGTNQTVSLSAGGGAWTPADTTAVAWYDAADASTITETAGAVSQWRDKSGKDHHASQGNGALQPTYNSNDTRLNNLPTIGYDQGYKFLDTPSLAAIRNVYFVTYYNDPDNAFDSHRVFFSDTGNANKLQGQAAADDWVAGKGFDKYKDGAVSSSDLNILPMGPTLWTARGTALHANKTWRMLGGIQNYQYWEYGAIGEIILTDGTEDLETQQKIEGYLAHKWGTEASLPIDHPYKSAAPTGGSAAVANLDGTVSDPDGDSFTTQWSVVSGPTGTIFGNAAAVDTTATFSAVGTYVLELTADDSTAQTSDQVTITVDDGSDTTAPTLAATDLVDDQAGANVTANGLVTYTVTFSEDMDAATVDATDFSNAGSASVTIGTITETSPGVFTVEVTPTTAGSLQLQVSAAAVLTDVAGNALDTTAAIADDTIITVDEVNVAPTWATNPVNEVDASEDAAYSSTLADDASDANTGDSLTFAKVSGPAWLTVAANGALSGTPTNADVGANAFTVSVSDSIAPAVNATLNISVTNTNDAPVADNQSVVTNEDTALAVTLTASDVDGDALTYTVVTAPTNGTLSGTAPNLSYTPNANYNGSDSFTFVANDGLVNSNVATVSITVNAVNDAPVANAQSVATDEDTAVAIILTASDVDGDLLAYTVVTAPTNGTLSGTTPNLTYTPNANYSGSDSFTFVANDGLLGSNTATISIMVNAVNDAPVFTVDPITGSSATEDALYAGTIAGSATDEDTGDTLTYAKVSGPAWLSVGIDGTLSGTPTNADVGANSFIVSVSDGTIVTPVEATLNITVNAAPTGSGTPILIDWSAVNDISGVADANGNYWNSLGAGGVGDASDLAATALVDSSNGASGISVAVDLTGNAANFTGSGFGGAGINGPTGTNPFNITGTDRPTIDGLYANYNDNGYAVISITGLAANSQYDFSAIGGRASGGSDGYIKVTAGTAGAGASDVDLIDTDDLLDTFALLNNGTVLNFSVTSDASGTIAFSFFEGQNDTDGGTSATLNALRITPPSATGNDAPVADDQSVTTNEDTAVAVTLTAGDADGDALTYTVVTAPINGTLSGTAPDLTYTPNANYNGSDSFTFVANDGTTDSNTATVSLTVNAVNDAPVADDQSVATDEDTAAGVTLTASDVDGDLLTYTIVTAPTNGMLSGTAPNLTYSPNADYYGSDSFTFVANDGTVDSNTATVSLTVNAVNDAPVADDQSVSTNEDTSLAVTLTAGDVDGDVLTYTVVTAPANGTLSGTAPDLTYTPNADYNGTDSFTFVANDGTTDSNTATVNLTVNAVNDAPLAGDQSVTTDEDTAVAITLTASDVDGDALTYTVVTAPTNGTLSGTAPNLTYTPNADYNGTDSFTFVANDGLLNSNTATVSLTVNAMNDAPVFASDPFSASNATEDAAYSDTIAGSATDVEGEALAYAKVAGPAWLVVGTDGALSGTPLNADVGSNSFTVSASDGTDTTQATLTIEVINTNDAPVADDQSVVTQEDTAVAVTLTASDVDGDALTYTVVTAPTNGTLSGTAPDLTYTPNANYYGTDSFSFVANDGTVNSNTATVSLTVNAVNDAPVADDQSVSTDEDTDLAVTLTASDAEGDALTYTVLTAPTNGVLTGTAPSLTYTPNSNYNGSDSFTFKANDGTADSNTATVSITVNAVNDAPVFVSDPFSTSDATEAQAYSDTISGSATDAEGDALTYAKVDGPTWLSVATDGTLSGTPGSADVGANSFTVSVSDGTAAAVTATLNLQVNGGSVADYAYAETFVSGTVSGSITDTFVSDNTYEAITEEEMKGKPSERYSYLEHKWEFDVMGGDIVNFNIEAHHSANSENDDFTFAYSTTGVDGVYTDMLTVTKTSDDNTEQSFTLPAGISGIVHVRVLDTDTTFGNNVLDTLSIDHMYILSEPSAP